MKIYPIKKSPAPHILIYFFFVLYGHLFLFLYKEPLTNILMGLTSPIQVDNFQKKNLFNYSLSPLIWSWCLFDSLSMVFNDEFHLVWCKGCDQRQQFATSITSLSFSLSHTLSFTFSFLYKIKFSLPISLGLYLYFVVWT